MVAVFVCIDEGFKIIASEFAGNDLTQFLIDCGVASGVDDDQTFGSWESDGG